MFTFYLYQGFYFLYTFYMCPDVYCILSEDKKTQRIRYRTCERISQKRYK